jgi:hypothetical protein
MKGRWQAVLRSLASRSGPFGLRRSETFWNSHGRGRARPRCLGQFQLSLSAEPRWAPRSSGEVRSGLPATCRN